MEINPGPSSHLLTTPMLPLMPPVSLECCGLDPGPSARQEIPLPLSSTLSPNKSTFKCVYIITQICVSDNRVLFRLMLTAQVPDKLAEVTSFFLSAFILAFLHLLDSISDMRDKCSREQTGFCFYGANIVFIESDRHRANKQIWLWEEQLGNVSQFKGVLLSFHYSAKMGEENSFKKNRHI